MIFSAPRCSNSRSTGKYRVHILSSLCKHKKAIKVTVDQAGKRQENIYKLRKYAKLNNKR